MNRSVPQAPTRSAGPYAVWLYYTAIPGGCTQISLMFKILGFFFCTTAHRSAHRCNHSRAGCCIQQHQRRLMRPAFAIPQPVFALRTHKHWPQSHKRWVQAKPRTQREPIIRIEKARCRFHQPIRKFRRATEPEGEAFRSAYTQRTRVLGRECRVSEPAGRLSKMYRGRPSTP
jgi:hypothetical protein